MTTLGLQGNPVAVVFEADGLSSAQMQVLGILQRFTVSPTNLSKQSFTAWTNLSEAVFVCKPTDGRAHYRLRIFDPTRELPFAGHPTLG